MKKSFMDFCSFFCCSHLWMNSSSLARYRKWSSAPVTLCRYSLMSEHMLRVAAVVRGLLRFWVTVFLITGGFRNRTVC